MSVSNLYVPGVKPETNLIVNSINIGSNLISLDNALEINLSGKAMLLPRLNTVARNELSAPTSGQCIFNIDDQQIEVYGSGVWSALGGGGPPSGLAGGDLSGAYPNPIVYNVHAPVANIDFIHPNTLSGNVEIDALTLTINTSNQDDSFNGITINDSSIGGLVASFEQSGIYIAPVNGIYIADSGTSSGLTYDNSAGHGSINMFCSPYGAITFGGPQINLNGNTTVNAGCTINGGFVVNADPGNVNINGYNTNISCNLSGNINIQGQNGAQGFLNILGSADGLGTTYLTLQGDNQTNLIATQGNINVTANAGDINARSVHLLSGIAGNVFIDSSNNLTSTNPHKLSTTFNVTGAWSTSSIPLNLDKNDNVVTMNYGPANTTAAAATTLNAAIGTVPSGYQPGSAKSFIVFGENNTVTGPLLLNVLANGSMNWQPVTTGNFTLSGAAAIGSTAVSWIAGA